MSNVPRTNRSMHRKPSVAALVVIGVLLLLGGFQELGFPDSLDALRIATWNLEHLNDTNAAGCVPRDQADYDAIVRRIREIDPDVVAFQEVENTAAALRVFPATHWRVEVSTRPETAATRKCWGPSGKYLHHQATGFAIRKEIIYHRNEDLESLGAPSFQRWGTDITITLGDRQLRLLSVHLKSGCWSTKEDSSSESRTQRSCTTLRNQIRKIRDWADRREDEGTAFAILGDFNRRLAASDDWAWRELSPESSPLALLTADIEYQCDPDYEEFIDHIVLDATAAALLVPNSTDEWPLHDDHPDHCAVSTDLQDAKP